MEGFAWLSQTGCSIHRDDFPKFHQLSLQLVSRGILPPKVVGQVTGETLAHNLLYQHWLFVIKKQLQEKHWHTNTTKNTKHSQEIAS